MNKFTDWLSRQMQKRNNLGVNQLAEYSGISSSMISNILAEKRNPSPKTVRKLADFFKVDEDWLLALAGHRSAKNVEGDLSRINDPNLRVWLSVENINKLSPATKRVIANLIREEIEERREEEEFEKRIKGKESNRE